MPSLTISINILKLTKLDNQLDLDMVILQQSTHTNEQPYHQYKIELSCNLSYSSGSLSETLANAC